MTTRTFQFNVTAPSAGLIASAASGLSSGQWVSADGVSAPDMRIPAALSNVGAGGVYTYGGRMYWSAATQSVQMYGATANQREPAPGNSVGSRLVIFDNAGTSGNCWQSAATPRTAAYSFNGDIKTSTLYATRENYSAIMGAQFSDPGYVWLGHEFDQSCVDPATGDFYWLHYGETIAGQRAGAPINRIWINRWAKRFTDAFSTTTTADSPDGLYGCHTKLTSVVAFNGETQTICWHPNLYGQGDGGLLMFAVQRLYAWRKATDTWAQIHLDGQGGVSGYPWTKTSAIYCPALDSVISIRGFNYSGIAPMATRIAAGSGGVVGAITPFSLTGFDLVDTSASTADGGTRAVGGNRGDVSPTKNFAFLIDCPVTGMPLALERYDSALYPTNVVNGISQGRAYRWNGTQWVRIADHPFNVPAHGSNAQAWNAVAIPEHGVVMAVGENTASPTYSWSRLWKVPA